MKVISRDFNIILDFTQIDLLGSFLLVSYFSYVIAILRFFFFVFGTFLSYESMLVHSIIRLKIKPARAGWRSYNAARARSEVSTSALVCSGETHLEQ